MAPGARATACSSTPSSSSRLATTRARALLANGIGQISRASENEDARKNLGPRAMASMTNAIQRHLISDTRLGIR
jgi:hypothetical protein